MRRRRRNAGLWLEKDIDVQAKTVSEIWPRIVISNDMLPFERQHRRSPFLKFSVNRGFELFVVGVVGGGVRGINRRKRLRDVLGDRFGNNRVDGKMRITERMHISGRARQYGWDFHQMDSLRRLDPPWLANLEF